MARWAGGDDVLPCLESTGESGQVFLAEKPTVERESNPRSFDGYEE
jgi:hypothetical protein